MSEKQRQYDIALKRGRELAEKAAALTESESNELAELAGRIPKWREELKNTELINRAMAESGGGVVGDEGPHGSVTGKSIADVIKGQAPTFEAMKAHGALVHPTLFGAKSDLIATQGDANPENLRGSGVAEIGRDGRYLFPALPTDIDLDLDPATTRVDFLKQTTRTLPAANDMQLAIDSSATKPVTDSVAALTSVEPKWIATISNPQANALFSQPALRDMLNKDMAQAYADSLDDYCVDAIAAASGANTLAQGGLVTLDAIRTAQGMVQDDGFSGDTVVLPSAVAVSIDLLKDANDRYYGKEFLSAWFPGGVRYSKTLASTAVQVISSETVTLHLSVVKFEIDTSLYFESNRTVARFEGLAAPIVRQGTGICLLTLN